MAHWKDADDNVRIPKHWTPECQWEPSPNNPRVPWILTAEDRVFLRVQRIAPDELVDDGA